MDYEIIFYHSGKTAETERLIEKKLGALSLSRGTSFAAVSPSELANGLKTALRRTNIAVIIGGLDGGKYSTDAILSLVLSSKASSMKCEKLLDDNDNIAYLIKAGRQYILVLPDEPEIIEEMLDKRMIKELCADYSLDVSEKSRTSIDEVTGKLKKQLSEMGMTRGSYRAQYAEKQHKELKLLSSLMWAALAAGIFMLILAIIFSVT